MKTDNQKITALLQEQQSDGAAQNPQPAKSGKGLSATGGLIGAVLASSCCVVPLVLVTLGVSGTWIGSLTALEPYKPIFIAISAAFLAYGFWLVYFKPAPPCEDGSYCAKPETSLLTKLALWFGVVIVLLSATITFWAPFFY
jgi:mercuric ion transport protein